MYFVCNLCFRYSFSVNGLCTTVCLIVNACFYLLVVQLTSFKVMLHTWVSDTPVYLFLVWLTVVDYDGGSGAGERRSEGKMYSVRGSTWDLPEDSWYSRSCPGSQRGQHLVFSIIELFFYIPVLMTTFLMPP